MTGWCAEAFGPDNVRVNCIAPGLVDTEMGREVPPEVLESAVAATPTPRMDSPTSASRRPARSDSSPKARICLAASVRSRRRVANKTCRIRDFRLAKGELTGHSQMNDERSVL